MPRYAANTEVPKEQTRAEIERTLERYGATAFQTGWNQESAMIQFQMNSLHVRFVLPIPKMDEKRFQWRIVRGHNKKATEGQAYKAWDQEIRQRWRALLLVIKAKLEAVDCRITTREQEFLAHIVMPNDMTIGQWIADSILPQITAGHMPKLLTGPKETVIDAEFQKKES